MDSQRRTTADPGVDLAAELPGIEDHLGSAIRLHPRPGTPTPDDSSVGGPLLWPVGEPWPTCGAEKFDFLGRGFSTPGTQGVDRRFRTPDTPVPMVALAQLYKKDFPEVPFPEGTDLAQILWCPHFHGSTGFEAHVAWRDSAGVGDVLSPPAPSPDAMDDRLPRPCVIHPERVPEYPWYEELPEELQERLQDWDADGSYQYTLSTAPGWKVGGSMNYSLTDGTPPLCPDCGSPTFLLLQVDGWEWGEKGAARWQPLEEHDLSAVPGYSVRSAQNPTGIDVNGGYHMGVYICPADPHHTVQAW